MSADQLTYIDSEEEPFGYTDGGDPVYRAIDEADRLRFIAFDEEGMGRLVHHVGGRFIDRQEDRTGAVLTLGGLGGAIGYGVAGPLGGLVGGFLGALLGGSESKR